MKEGYSLIVMQKAVAYYRVSTEEQEESRLSLEAQAHAVSRFAETENYTIINEFTEQQSGKDNDRPILLAALALCKKERATLIVDKLDRLSRSVAFTAGLLESKANFRAVDMPTADKLQIHIRAVFSEYERDQISIRTKRALEALKRRGVQLGRHGAQVLSKANAATANEFAEQMRPTIEMLKGEGFKTVAALRDEMNRRQILTFTKAGKWHACSVHAILKRLKANTLPQTAPQ